MNRLTNKVLNVGLAVALVAGVCACNRSADSAAPGDAGLPAGAVSTPGAPSAPAAPIASGAPDNGARYAQVVSVDPVRSTRPSQVCHDETVTHTAPPKDQHRIAGTAIGAVAGGLLGHMVGGGKGNTVATVAGAVGGGYAGNRIEASHQQGQVVTTVQHHCETVSNPNGDIVGYDVHYVYNGVTRTVRMDHDPGDRVQLQ